ncbi:unnamed protein product [Lampetra planeri]
MDPAQKMDHLLALKVMRLTRPSLHIALPVSCEERDLAGGLLGQCPPDRAAFVSGGDCTVLGDMLTLPQNFGNIFLGETFSSYISVHNDSSQLVRDVSIKADLQTSSQRLNLSGGSTLPAAELHPDSCIDDVIHHEVKELGTHILVCAVSYATQSAEKLYFRKFFKFQVLKPLEVKTKFYNAEDELSAVCEEVFLEAQIQNITSSPMCVERVWLEPSPLYAVAPLNAVVDTDPASRLSEGRYLGPGETRQFLYRLRARPDVAEKAGAGGLRGVTHIGKMDIVWRTNLGERGRLQTSQLQRVAPGYGDVRLEIETIPDMAHLEEPFTVAFKITNCSERTMDLRLELRSSDALCWCGLLARDLGRLPSASSRQAALMLLPAMPGLQSVSGIRLTDTFLKRTYEFDDVAQVLVLSEEDEEEEEEVAVAL